MKLQANATSGTAVCLVVLLVTHAHVFAQQMNLVAEHQKTREQVVLSAGSSVQYKTATSLNYLKGTLVEFSDSTFVIKDKREGSVTVLFRDLSALKLRGSSGRRATGTVLTILGGLGTLVGLVAVATQPSKFDASGVSGTSNTAGLIIGAVGLPMLVGGIALRSDRVINLEAKWKLKVILAK